MIKFSKHVNSFKKSPDLSGGAECWLTLWDPKHKIKDLLL